MSGPVVFISYSHKDERWKELLVTQLSVLRYQGILDPWDDRRIGTGEDWYEKISEAMSRASVAVLLVTANFLSSQFILSEEVPQLLQRRKHEGMHVFPVLAAPCDWEAVRWLSRMQFWPRDGRTLSRGTAHEIDADLASLTKQIRLLLSTATATPTPPPTVEQAPQLAHGVCNDAAPVADVLVVEPHRGLREILERILLEEGLKVTAVTNSRHAMEYISEQVGAGQPDVVIFALDPSAKIIQDFQDWLEAENHHIPLILMSSRLRESYPEVVLERTAHFLEKPFNLEHFLAVLSECLPLAKARRIR